MALKKPSDFFEKNTEEDTILEVIQDDSLHEELNKVENLSEQINQLQKELSQKLVKNDLEITVLNQINTMQGKFDFLQDELKSTNKRDIVELKNNTIEIAELVNNLILNEIPKYKKKVTRNEIYVQEKLDQIKEVVQGDIVNIREDIDNKFDKIVTVVNDDINYFNQQLQETSSEIEKTIKYNVEKIEDVFEKVNNIHDKVSYEISNIKAEVVIFEQHHKDTKKAIEEFSESLPKIDNVIEYIENKVEGLSFETNSTKENINKIGKDVEIVERYIQKHYKDLEELKEEVFSEIKKLPLGNIQDNIQRLEEKIEFIRESYSKIEPEILVKEVISEGLLNEPSDTKNSDTLTPLNQNFVTLDQLQEHYRLFINRIQQQLSTIGGGGETRLKYLDDIVGIATNPSIYDGKFLKYNHSIGKFEFVTVSGGGGGGSYDSYWASNNTGISTSSRVAIGTDTATSSLTVIGDAYVSGIVTATDFNSASDIKLKENIKVIDNPIDKILKIEGVNFSWKDTKRNSMGVIAQEIEKVIPELVSGDELKTVNYNGIVGLLIECIKNQQNQIDDLKKLLINNINNT